MKVKKAVSGGGPVLILGPRVVAPLPPPAECTLCEAGKTSDKLHAEGCTPCARGHAQPLVGAALEHCPACVPGKYSAGLDFFRTEILFTYRKSRDLK